jgi:hypothetical protein
MASLEDLTSDHFREFYADFVPKDIVGYALRGDDGKIICLGGIWFIEGVAWATFGSVGTPPPHVHRTGARILKSVKEAGVKVVWAELDESKPNARKWLERFGFEHHSYSSDGIPIWRLELDGRPSDHDSDGGQHGNERLRVVP